MYKTNTNTYQLQAAPASVFDQQEATYRVYMST